MSDSGGISRASQREKAKPPLFLERHGYRRRRMMDFARILPILGAVLFMVPLLWATPGEEGSTVSMSQAITYLFLVWAGLILLSALLAMTARHWSQNDGADGPG